MRRISPSPLPSEPLFAQYSAVMSTASDRGQF
jgi:hypothetical protein